MAHSVSEILGRTDAELIDGDSTRITALKREVVQTGAPAQAEISLPGEGGARWYDVHMEAVFDESHRVTGLMGVAVDVTDRHERESRIELLLREITHRSKNLLAVIQSMARQTAMRTASRSEFVDVFSRRIQSLALSHDLLIQGDWAGAAIGRIVHSQLAPFAELIGTRIEVEGPELHLKPEAAQGLGLAVHELVTNAAKFGALSVPGGTIRVSWSLGGANGADKWILFEWRERGMREPRPPVHRGFGHVVLETATARALSGTSSFVYSSDGATWSLQIPGEWITNDRVRAKS